MKIAIPMAGYGTRLRPHTWSKPKPLVSVAGKAVLGHVLDMFASVPDVEEIIFIVGYLGDQAEAYMSEHYPDVSTQFIVQEEMLRQSHALWLAREHLRGPICMAFVDTIIEADLSNLTDEKADAVAWVKQVDDPRRFGVVELDEQGSVIRLIEKPDDVSNDLAGMGEVREAVNHRNDGVVGKLRKARMAVGAQHDGIDIARQNSGGVGNTLSAPKL